MIQLKSWYTITQYETQTEFGNMMLERIVNQNIEKIVYNGSKYNIKPKQFRLYFDDGIKIQLEKIFDYIYELKDYIIIDSTFNAGENSREKRKESAVLDYLSERTCYICGETKLANSFYVDSWGKFMGKCKKCHKDSVKQRKKEIKKYSI